jgi:hypothetical protein
MDAIGSDFAPLATRAQALNKSSVTAMLMLLGAARQAPRGHLAPQAPRARLGAYVIECGEVRAFDLNLHRMPGSDVD